MALTFKKAIFTSYEAFLLEIAYALNAPFVTHHLRIAEIQRSLKDKKNMEFTNKLKKDSEKMRREWWKLWKLEQKAFLKYKLHSKKYGLKSHLR